MKHQGVCFCTVFGTYLTCRPNSTPPRKECLLAPACLLRPRLPAAPGPRTPVGWVLRHWAGHSAAAAAAAAAEAAAAAVAAARAPAVAAASAAAALTLGAAPRGWARNLTAGCWLMPAAAAAQACRHSSD